MTRMPSLIARIGLFAAVAAVLLAAGVSAQTYNPNTPAAPLPPGAAPPPPQAAQPAPNQNPVCARLEGQLGMIDRGQGDANRAAQLKRYEDGMGKQQGDLDRLVAQQRRLGCQSAGIFSIFMNQPPQCNALNNQIEQARTTLDRTTGEYQRMQAGGAGEMEAQRQQVLGQLAQNNCGPQYRAAA